MNRPRGFSTQGAFAFFVVVFSVMCPRAANSTLLQTLIGETSRDHFGSALARIGDVNGDSHDDFAVGAPYWGSSEWGAAEGRVYIFFGGPGLDSTPDLILQGVANNEQFGCAVAAAGDVNADSFEDLLVGAHQWHDSNDLYEGRAYVFFGGPGMDAVPDLILQGGAYFERFGYSVAPAGDLNADSYSDFLVGGPTWSPSGWRKGCAYVFFGGPELDSIPDLVLEGNVSREYFGLSVATAGDVNADSYDDFLVGGPGWGASGSNEGRAYVFFGGPGLDAIPDLVIVGESPGDELGWSLAGVGDANGDTHDDFLAGAPFWSAGATGETGEGRAYLYFGGTGLDASADVVMTGESPNDRFGGCVAAAGDVNGDSFADFLAGAPYWSSSETQESEDGRAYLFHGSSFVDETADLVFTGEPFCRLGYSLAPAGDCNNGGFDEILLGAPGQAHEGNERVGCAYVQGFDLHLTGVTPTVSSLASFRVDAPWPNPGRSHDGLVNVAFVLPHSDEVLLELYDVLGRRVAARDPQVFSTDGSHAIAWSPGAVPAGVYFLRVRTESGLSGSARWTVVR